MKKLVFAGVVALWAMLVVGCSDPSDTPMFPEEKVSEEMGLKLSGWKVDSLDKEKQVIHVSPTKGWLDSLVIDSLSLPGCASFYLAADDDLLDPELGEKLVPGTVISTADTNQVSIVALDSYNRVVGVWLVVWDLPKKASSSSGTAQVSGSSVSVDGDGSSVSGGDSSAGEGNSSASEGNSVDSGSSSAGGMDPAGNSADSGSSTDSGSSLNTSSSSSETISGVKLADLSVSSGTVTVTGTKVYVEVPYGSDLSAITLSPLNGAKDLRRPVEMQFLDAEDKLGTYSVVAGVQLPGSDFSARNDFWATTSDAMATEGRASVALGTNYRFKAEENLFENGESLSLSSKVVTCGWGAFNAIIDGSWKLAGGFYFVGAYSGSDAKNIYDVDYSSGTPSTDESNIAKDMTFGKPFTARPIAFTVKYSYTHKANSSSSYPQKSLVYVMLVGEGGKVVATGAFSDNASTDVSEREVQLSYGADPFGLLSDGYAVAEGLTLGTGNENVTSIHVMFASSAYAHVVAGGTAGSSGKYRGGENSSLTLDDFKLIY